MICGNCFLRRVLSFILIFIGVILMICFTPVWIWLSIVGTCLIVIGCVLLRRKY